jgi:hypothetical protein
MRCSRRLNARLADISFICGIGRSVVALPPLSYAGRHPELRIGPFPGRPNDHTFRWSDRLRYELSPKVGDVGNREGVVLWVVIVGSVLIWVWHPLALQLPFRRVSQSMGNHDSKIVGADSVD